jgi:hypothetical protein
LRRIGAIQREHQGKLLSGEPIDSGAERGKLIQANNRFVAALDRALRTGAETIEAVEATVKLRQYPRAPVTRPLPGHF